MHPAPSRFQKFELNAVELNAARGVSAYFFVYLQNKIADYAMATAEYTYDPTLGEQAMLTAIIEHEKLKAQVAVLEELMGELMPPVEQSTEQSGTQPL